MIFRPPKYTPAAKAWAWKELQAVREDMQKKGEEVIALH